jgi:hypothetical protein
VTRLHLQHCAGDRRQKGEDDERGRRRPQHDQPVEDIGQQVERDVDPMTAVPEVHQHGDDAGQVQGRHAERGVLARTALAEERDHCRGHAAGEHQEGRKGDDHEHRQPDPAEQRYCPAQSARAASRARLAAVAV